MLIAGRYRLETSIGRGAMGEVWRAYDETLGRPVAVKLLLAQEADPTAASRFRLEAQTAGRLNHPHVVGVLDFGEHEARLFLVMELVEGDSLASAGRRPAEEVARIAAQAAAGLAAAHRQGIVHRDIKPANLLLDAGGTVKIGDFGIARFLDDPAAALTAAGQIVGTSLYLAPERALGRPAGGASDVYSLGCVLYQLLTGRVPFQADTALAILHQHLDAPPVPPRELGIHVPPAFENYLLGLLAKEPEERPTAQQTADWFATGAWQGRPEPLPAAAPAFVQRTVSPAGPVRSPGIGTGHDVPVGEAGPATTYVLPSAGRTGSPSPRVVRQRPGVRHLVAHRPKLVSAVAGTVIFLAAMLAGKAWWSPDNNAAETSPTSPSSATSPDPASTPSAEPRTTPTPTSPVPGLSSAAPSPADSILSDDEGQETDGTWDGDNATEERKKGKEGRERRGEDEDD